MTREREPNLTRSYPPFYTLSPLQYTGVGFTKWTSSLAALYRVQERYDAAEPLYQRALAIMEQQLGPEHPDVAACLHNLALLYGAQERYREAVPLSQRALTIAERQLGPEHPNVAAGLTNLAELYRAQGQYDAAEPLYQRALAIVGKRLSPEHPHVAEVVKHYIAFLQVTNRKAEAVQLEMQWLANWLGIQVKPSTEPLGLFVEHVMDESPTAQAGIQPRDVIVRFCFNTNKELHSSALLNIVAAGIGSTLDIEVIHDGQQRTIPVTLGKKPVSRP